MGKTLLSATKSAAENKTCLQVVQISPSRINADRYFFPVFRGENLRPSGSDWFVLCTDLQGSLISSTFTVTSSTRDYQPVLNLKSLNQFMPTGPCHTGSCNDLNCHCLQGELSSKINSNEFSLGLLGFQIS